MGRRHFLLVGAFLLITLLYVDRVVIPAAKEQIAGELLLSDASVECFDPNIPIL